MQRAVTKFYSKNLVLRRCVLPMKYFTDSNNDGSDDKSSDLDKLDEIIRESRKHTSKIRSNNKNTLKPVIEMYSSQNNSDLHDLTTILESSFKNRKKRKSKDLKFTTKNFNKEEESLSEEMKSILENNLNIRDKSSSDPSTPELDRKRPQQADNLKVILEHNSAHCRKSPQLDIELEKQPIESEPLLSEDTNIHRIIEQNSTEDENLQRDHKKSILRSEFRKTRDKQISGPKMQRNTNAAFVKLASILKGMSIVDEQTPYRRSDNETESIEKENTNSGDSSNWLEEILANNDLEGSSHLEKSSMAKPLYSAEDAYFEDESERRESSHSKDEQVPIDKDTTSESDSDKLSRLLEDIDYHHVHKHYKIQLGQSTKESFINKIDPSKRLNIFNKSDVKVEQEESDIAPNIMDIIESCEYRQLNMLVPDSQFHEWIHWTRDKKMWHFPIDNEQDSEELNVGFDEHVFPQQYLSGRLPTTGLVGQFMNYVCIGLSQSPHLTVKQKKEHIEWYEEYLSNKLSDIDMAMEKNIQDRIYEEKLRNK